MRLKRQRASLLMARNENRLFDRIGADIEDVIKNSLLGSFNLH
jgi:hypothetical protein